MTVAPIDPVTINTRDSARPFHQPHRPGFGALVAMESGKLLKRPVTWISTGLLTAGLAAVMLLGDVTIQSANIDAALRASRIADLTLPKGIDSSFDVLGQVGPVVMAVVAALIVGSEFSWGTMRVLVASGASRSKILLSKVVVLGVFTATVVILATASGALASLAITVAHGVQIPSGTFNAPWFGELAWTMARTWLVMFTLAVVSFSVATLARSVAAGIAVGIGWLTLERVLIVFLGSLGSLGSWIMKGLLLININGLLRYNGPLPHAVDPGTPVEWHTVVILAGYCLTLLLAAIVVFQRRDISSGGS
jgi:ABC-2 type transport system permease protein